MEKKENIMKPHHWNIGYHHRRRHSLVLTIIVGFIVKKTLDSSSSLRVSEGELQ